MIVTDYLLFFTQALHIGHDISCVFCDLITEMCHFLLVLTCIAWDSLRLDFVKNVAFARVEVLCTNMT